MIPAAIPTAATMLAAIPTVPSNNGKPLAACRIQGCGRPVRNQTHQLCKTHNEQRLAGKPYKPIRLKRVNHGLTCTECHQPYYAAGFCKRCYFSNVKRHLTPEQKARYAETRRARYKERMESDPVWRAHKLEQSKRSARASRQRRRSRRIRALLARRHF